MRRYGSGSGWDAAEAAKAKKRRMREIKAGVISPLTPREKYILYLVAGAVALIIIAMIAVASCSCGGAKDKGERPDPAQTGTVAPAAELPDVASYPRLLTSGEGLSASYIPPGLTNLYGLPGGSALKLRFEAAGQFVDMYNAMIADGMAMNLLSAYRTDLDMLVLYNKMITEYTETMAVSDATELLQSRIGRPGHDEHQLGYSVSVSASGRMDVRFMSSDQGRWLKERAADYGFVFRFPEDKKEITGRFAPWELRYVGVEAAKYVTNNDLCLEEYVELMTDRRPEIPKEE